MKHTSMGFFRLLINTLLGLFVSTGLFAQVNLMPDLNKSQIPPSPDAASLGKFGFQPPVLYEGQAGYSIPLYEIKAGTLSFPINLSYNNNGYRPGEESSWVGMGWSLQATGVITRMVKGLVDGQTPTVEHSWDDYAGVLSLSNNQDILTKVADQKIDAEPDLYAYNFNGHSGKFILVKDRAFTFPHQDIKITKIGVNFLIVDESGTKYYFNELETTTSGSTPTSTQNYVPTYTSAWNLSSIVSADGTNTIGFQYASWQYVQSQAAYSESYSITTPCDGMSWNCDQLNTSDYKGGVITAKRLTQITSKNCRIEFVPESANRADIAGSSSAYALKEINIYRLPDDEHLKRYTFNHDYFKEAANLSSHLKLTSIGMYGAIHNGVPTVSMPDYYSFSYIDETASYVKFTRGIDRFGYYNGQTSNTMLFEASLLPRPMKYAPANRDVSQAFCKMGMLEKVKFPTGGYMRYDYENNRIRMTTENTVVQQRRATGQANNNGSGNAVVYQNTFQLESDQTVHIEIGREIPGFNPLNGGIQNTNRILRIDKVQHTPGDPDVIYQVYESPLLAAMEVYRNIDVALTAGDYIYKVTCDPNIQYAYTYAFINYTAIIPYTGEPGPGMRVKTVEIFTSPTSTVPASAKRYTYDLAKVINMSGNSTSTYHEYYTNYGFGVDHDITTFTADFGGSLSTLATNQFYYPSVTEYSDENGTAGKTVYTYDGDGTSALGIYLKNQTDFKFTSPGSVDPYVKVKETKNEYSIQPKIDFFGFSTSKKSNISPLYASCPSCYGGDTYDVIMNRVALYEAKPYTLTSNNLQLTSTEEKVYSPEGTQQLSTRTEYYYDNPNYNQASRTVVKKSNGDILTTITKYPYDCGVNPSVTSSCSFPAFQLYWFKQKRADAMVAYSACLNARTAAAAAAVGLHNPPVWNGYNQELKDALNAYPCEDNYPNQFVTALASIATVPCPPQTGYNDAGVAAMLANHITNVPVETIVTLNKGGTDYLLKASRTAFAVNTTNPLAIAPEKINITENAAPVPLSSFTANPDNFFKSRVSYKYDQFSNLKEVGKENDQKIVYLWGYSNEYPVAKIIGSDNTTVSQVVTQQQIDAAAASTDENAMRTLLNNLRTNSLTSSSQVFTYTYKPLTGITSETDPRGRTTYYEYDGLNRLVFVKDHDNKILKKICYNYAGQPENCTVTAPCVNLVPDWQNTTTALRCQTNSCGVYTGYQEQEQKDMNSCSPTYNQTQWVPAGYNPGACAPATSITLTSTNLAAVSGYVATYTNTSTGAVYTFNIPAGGGLLNLGCIPAGTYNLTIQKPSGNIALIFYSGCGKKSVSGTSATFYFVSVSSTTCNSIKIDAY